jgi:hypothetical protein
MRQRFSALMVALALVLGLFVLTAGAASAGANCTKIRSEPTSVGYLSIDLAKGAPFQEDLKLFPGQTFEGCDGNQPKYYKLTNGFGTRVDVVHQYWPGNPDYIRNGSTDGVEPGWYTDMPPGTFTNMILVRR